MKLHLRSALLLPLTIFTSALGLPLTAQETKTPEPPATEPAGEAKPADKKDAKPLSELEAKFRATLTKATMSGRWCMVKDGVMTPDKEEKYTISGVTRLWGENWLIHSRIEYGNKDVTVPVPVKVKWAGDTAVITVDDFGIPGGSKYSARVMIYNGTYAGTWSGGQVGGLLHGVITQEKTEEKPVEKPADKTAEKPSEKAAEK